jgi:lipopolysaccharide export system protein LptA
MTTPMTRRTRVLAAACFSGALLATGAADSQPAPAASHAPTDVTADGLEVIDSQHLAIYRGNVEAVQEGHRLVSDVLNVYFEDTGASGAKAAPAKPKTVTPSTGGVAEAGSTWGSIRQLVADGHVFFVSTNQTARGNHAVYDVAPDTITMTGDVVMVQGDNVIKGDKVIIQVKTGHADVISNVVGRNKPDRVRGVFYNSNAPANGQAAAPAAAPAKP